MNILCKLLGHKIPSGYGNHYGAKYLDVRYTSTDGLGVEHAALDTNCERCGKSFQVGKIHLPARNAERFLKLQLERTTENKLQDT